MKRKLWLSRIVERRNEEAERKDPSAVGQV